jgi:hypothetical protein
MKPIFVLLCTLACHQLYAQERIIQADLYGDWICREVKVVTEDPDMKEAGEIMKSGFLTAHFVFRTDGMFRLILPQDASVPVRKMMFLDNKKWFFFPDKAMITIGTLQENLMQIFAKMQNGYMTFFINEMPLVLKMEKL